MRIVFENKDLIGMREASKLLGISGMTLHRWCHNGKIQAVKVGTYRVIPKSEIDRLVGKKNG